MCCKNKKKKEEKQAELERYMDRRMKQFQVREKSPSAISDRLNKRQSLARQPSKIEELQSNISKSKLTMQKMFQKSKIQIEQFYDPSTTHFFQDCTAQRIDIRKISTQHIDYVRKEDYYEISQQHAAQLDRIVPREEQARADYSICEDFSLLTPSVNKFCYDFNVVDINFRPRVPEYQRNYFLVQYLDNFSQKKSVEQQDRKRKSYEARDYGNGLHTTPISTYKNARTSKLVSEISSKSSKKGNQP